VEIEDSGMWKVRTEIVAIIIGALGTKKKGLGRNLQLVRGHPASSELQEINLMSSTAHSICEVLG
jgi:hypothetical protein